jgi:hypothetical protein
MASLINDVFLSASFLTYFGYFDYFERGELLDYFKNIMI